MTNRSTPAKNGHPERDVYSVSRLNSEARAVLEGSFPLIWVEGEISNLAQPASGHIYFSLKDSHSQVRCAMFRMKRQYLRFKPANGVAVLARVRISLYEARGEFQLIVEQMQPAGEGALQQAFLALKEKLSSEGLFDQDRKQPIPAAPVRIGVITSPSGAAIKDVLSVLKRRSPSIPVLIYPVTVQGESAAGDIVQALELANQRQDCDLLILTRGGGSLEDLMAFNDEQVARAVVQSRIPLISAVGHEIDFTISDFVADRRAPTPSAAAELASPDSHHQIQRFKRLELQFHSLARRWIERQQQRLQGLNIRLRLCHPGKQLEQKSQRVDELEQRILRAMSHRLTRLSDRHSALTRRLRQPMLQHRLQHASERVEKLSSRLVQSQNDRLTGYRERVVVAVTTLDAISPLSTLSRGYSITRSSDAHILRDSRNIAPGDELETRLHEGTLFSRVIRTEPD